MGNQRLNGKKAVITGATSGIGHATAKRFIEEGAEILITGRSEDRVQQALEALGSQAHGLVADSTKMAELEKLASRAKDQFRTVDVLFVNAGNGMFAPIEQIDEALYARQFDLNVKAAIFTVQKILPLMGKGGSILLTASAVHTKGAPGGSLYFASKAAVRSLARTMAAELGPRGIRVNALSPGIVPTRFFKNSNAPEELYDDFDAMAGKGSPLGRAGQPEEVAEAAVFLAADESSFMTAADLVVDGGWMNV